MWSAETTSPSHTGSVGKAGVPAGSPRPGARYCTHAYTFYIHTLIVLGEICFWFRFRFKSSFYHCDLWMIKRKRNQRLFSPSTIIATLTTLPAFPWKSISNISVQNFTTVLIVLNSGKAESVITIAILVIVVISVTNLNFCGMLYVCRNSYSDPEIIWVLHLLNPDVFCSVLWRVVTASGGVKWSVSGTSTARWTCPNVVTRRAPRWWRPAPSKSAPASSGWLHPGARYVCLWVIAPFSSVFPVDLFTLNFGFQWKESEHAHVLFHRKIDLKR